MRILFLDLDGTVRYSNHPSGFINKPEDIEVYPEAAEQISKFCKAGWNVAYISNQGGIAAGFTTVDAFIDGLALTEDALDESFDAGSFCHHAVEAGCICRKPLPGMVVQIINQIHAIHHYQEIVDVRHCLFVGDRPEDEGCAKACGIPFVSAEDWRAGKIDPYGTAESISESTVPAES